MKLSKVIIAAITVVLASNALGGCADQPVKDITVSELGMARIEAALELRKTAELSLREISRQGEEVQFELVISNPQHEPVTSVESWLSFNPKWLKGITFEPNEEQFELTAPYQNGFDPMQGLLKLGRSTAQPITDQEIVLATFSFQILDDSQPLIIEPYDYRYDLKGHMSVNKMIGKMPVNILLKPSFSAAISSNQ